MAFRIQGSHLAKAFALALTAQPVEVPTEPMALRHQKYGARRGAAVPDQPVCRWPVYLGHQLQPPGRRAAPPTWPRAALDGLIRLPVYEDASGKWVQIEEFLMQFRGEGIQHITL